MKQRLIKVENDYRLLDKNNSIIGTTDLEYQQAFSDVCQKLSIKNCEVVENGYNLDELSQELINNFTGDEGTVQERIFARTLARTSFVKGFQKALELLGDKKFSEEEFEKIKKLNDYLLLQINSKALNKIDDNNFLKNISHVYEGINKEIKSLQENEWEVVIEMEVVSDFDSRAEIDGQVFTTNKKQVPKLDANGCITLKRKV